MIPTLDDVITAIYLVVAHLGRLVHYDSFNSNLAFLVQFLAGLKSPPKEIHATIN